MEESGKSLVKEEKKRGEKGKKIEVIYGSPDHAEILAEFSAKLAFEIEGITVDTKVISKALRRL